MKTCDKCGAKIEKELHFSGPTGHTFLKPEICDKCKGDRPLKYRGGSVFLEHQKSEDNGMIITWCAKCGTKFENNNYKLETECVKCREVKLEKKDVIT